MCNVPDLPGCLLTFERVQQIPEFSDLGPIFRSSKPVELTEAEVEYVVSCTKHVFSEHLVLQVCECGTVFHDAIGRKYPMADAFSLCLTSSLKL